MGSGQYQQLKVWQKSIDFVSQIYAVTRSFPTEERYLLVDQIRRCAISIPSNIAEGSYRQTDKEFVHFLAIARGSAAELETQLLIAKNLHYIDESTCTGLSDKVVELLKMLAVLIKRITQD
ncbi:MAG TPA: four helix bundle protein [bacterium]|nr:four helix bundle protein [bacterium]